MGSSAAALKDAMVVPRDIEEDAPSPEQIEIYRRMTPGRRLEIAEQLYWGARAMKAAWIRSLHPDWPSQQVEAEVQRIFSNARS
jgi:hypothetical protein